MYQTASNLEQNDESYNYLSSRFTYRRPTYNYYSTPNSSNPAIRTRRSKNSLLLLILVICSIMVVITLSDTNNNILEQMIQSTASGIKSTIWMVNGNGNSDQEDGIEHEELEEGKYHGRYPHSLLTLFYPYTVYRDIVLDQPINMTDIPFFWHLHKSDEIIYKQVLTKCYGLQIIELDSLESIQNAVDVELVNGLNRNQHVITSPFIRETAEIFTNNHFGRMLCFFRHPLDYDLHPALPSFPMNDNWLTRLLSNVHDRDVTFKELGIAKQVVRQTCLVGTMDKMKTSIIRFQEHFGWSYKDGMSAEQGEKCIDDAMAGNVPVETWLDHEGIEFKTFYESNKMDCQLYELAQSAWRHQIQTIVPWNTQLLRDEDEDDDEEEEDE